MEKGMISHRAAGNECYALNEAQLVITIKTGYDVAEVFLHYGDPFSSGIMGSDTKWSGERVKMEPRSGQEKGKRLYTKNVCPTKSGGQQHFCLCISDANIILNFMAKTGKRFFILRMAAMKRRDYSFRAGRNSISFFHG